MLRERPWASMPARKRMYVTEIASHEMRPATAVILANQLKTLLDPEETPM